MKSILLDIRRNVFSPISIVSVILSLLMLSEKLISIEVNYYSYGDLISYCFLFTPFIVFAPIISSVVGSGIICDDIQSGCIKSILIRMSKEKYAVCKFISGICSGGLVMGIASAVLMGIIMLIGIPIGMDYNSTLNGPFDGTAFESIQYLSDGLYVILMTIILSFIFGAVWTAVGMAFSVYVHQKYLAIAFPLVLYYLLNMLSLKVEGLLKFAPMYTIVPGTTVINSIAFIFIEQIVFLIFIYSVYFIGIEMKMKNV